MSRRASLFAKEHPGKKRPLVRFPDELVFLDSIKENDMEATCSMLRRASITIDINSIGDSGMTPLHQAVLDGNLVATRLLANHGANINMKDDDSWTPLHAACAEGHTEVVRFLLSQGVDKTILTDEGERPVDLIDPHDFQTIAVMLSHGRTSPPPGRTDSEDEEDEEDEEEGCARARRAPCKAGFNQDEEEEEEEDDEEEEEDEESVPLRELPNATMVPLKSCLKSKLTIHEESTPETA